MSSTKREEKMENQIGDYLLNEEIGSGGFAKVVVGVHIPTGEKVAIKIMDKKQLYSDSLSLKRVMNEISILKIVRHKNIIKLYEVMETPKKLYLVMEYCNGGELFDYIVSKQSLSEKQACIFFHELLDALEYLHAQNIVHRDIKPENILLNISKKKITLKLIDFGISNTYALDSLLSTPCGTASYAAPEMHRGNKYFGLLTDIWSAGVVLYAMLYGYLPFFEEDEDKNINNIIHGYYDIPEGTSAILSDLLRHLLDINPLSRYDFEQIKAHPWFNLISSDSSRPGLILGYHKIPVDEHIIDLCSEYGYNKKDVRDSVINNSYNSNSAIYYIILKKITEKGETSISDLTSKEFLNYICDSNNVINENETTNPTQTQTQSQQDCQTITIENNSNNNNNNNNININKPNIKNEKKLEQNNTNRNGKKDNKNYETEKKSIKNNKNTKQISFSNQVIQKGLGIKDKNQEIMKNKNLKINNEFYKTNYNKNNNKKKSKKFTTERNEKNTKRIYDNDKKIMNKKSLNKEALSKINKETPSEIKLHPIKSFFIQAKIKSILDNNNNYNGSSSNRNTYQDDYDQKLNSTFSQKLTDDVKENILKLLHPRQKNKNPKTKKKLIDLKYKIKNKLSYRKEKEKKQNINHILKIQKNYSKAKNNNNNNNNKENNNYQSNSKKNNIRINIPLFKGDKNKYTIIHNRNASEEDGILRHPMKVTTSGRHYSCKKRRILSLSPRNIKDYNNNKANRKRHNNSNISSSEVADVVDRNKVKKIDNNIKLITKKDKESDSEDDDINNIRVTKMIKDIKKLKNKNDKELFSRRKYLNSVDSQKKTNSCSHYDKYKNKIINPEKNKTERSSNYLSFNNSIKTTNKNHSMINHNSINGNGNNNINNSNNLNINPYQTNNKDNNHKKKNLYNSFCNTDKLNDRKVIRINYRPSKIENKLNFNNSMKNKKNKNIIKIKKTMKNDSFLYEVQKYSSHLSPINNSKDGINYINQYQYQSKKKYLSMSININQIKIGNHQKCKSMRDFEQNSFNKKLMDNYNNNTQTINSHIIMNYCSANPNKSLILNEQKITKIKSSHNNSILNKIKKDASMNINNNNNNINNSISSNINTSRLTNMSSFDYKNLFPKRYKGPLIIKDILIANSASILSEEVSLLLKKYKINHTRANPYKFVCNKNCEFFEINIYLVSGKVNLNSNSNISNNNRDNKNYFAIDSENGNLYQTSNNYYCQKNFKLYYITILSKKENNNSISSSSTNKTNFELIRKTINKKFGLNFHLFNNNESSTIPFQ